MPAKHAAVRPRGKPPRPWWDYEEELARVKLAAKRDLSELRERHTQDLGILLNEQVQLREQMMTLAGARDDGTGGAPTVGGLAAALASTANEAQALHLSLLEKQNGSLKAEALAANANARNARKALEQHGEQERAELARLRAAVVVAAAQLKASPAAAQRTPPTPTPTPPGRPAALPRRAEAAARGGGTSPRSVAVVASDEGHQHREEQARLRRQLEATQAL